MKAINIIFVMLAVNSGVLSSAQEQNQGEIEPQEANEQRALPVDVEIDGVGRVLKNYQQLFDTNELEDETEDGDTHGRELTSKSTKSPTIKSTKAPTIKSTKAPTIKSTKAPTIKSTKAPTIKSTKVPSRRRLTFEEVTGYRRDD